MEDLKISLEPIWFRWVYKGNLSEDAPEEVKQAYDEYMKKYIKW